MTEQAPTEPKEELKQIITVLKNGEIPQISEDTIGAIGLNHNTLAVKSERDCLPITHKMHYLSPGIWVAIETHSNQQGPQRTIHQVNGIGSINLTPLPIDCDALRNNLQHKSDELDTDIDSIVDAVHNINQSIAYWVDEELVDGPSGIVATDSRIYVNSFLGFNFDDYPNIDLNESEKSVVRDAIFQTHGRRGSGISRYNFPHTVHYVLDYELDAGDVTVTDLIEKETRET